MNITCDPGSNKPENEWDEWYATTHKDTRASWEEDDDSDELDFQIERDED